VTLKRNTSRRSRVFRPSATIFTVQLALLTGVLGTCLTGYAATGDRRWLLPGIGLVIAMLALTYRFLTNKIVVGPMSVVCHHGVPVRIEPVALLGLERTFRPSLFGALRSSGVVVITTHQRRISVAHIRDLEELEQEIQARQHELELFRVLARPL
jgi:hypothetical protein